MALALAIELGGSHGVAGVVRDRELLAHRRFALHAGQPIEASLAQIEHAVKALLTESGVATGASEGVALLVPSLVDPVSRRIVSTNDKFSGAERVDLVAWARSHLALRLVLENDARAALLGECYAGAAQGVADVLMITLGTGIGAAVTLGGVPLRSRQAQAGTLGGHIPVNLYGRACTCGAIGCMEAEASTWALPAIASAWPGYIESALAQSAHDGLNFERLFAAARAGDRVAREVRDHCIRVWAVGTVGLIHAYGPELILFGGGVMGSASEILAAIREYVARHAWVPTGSVTIREAALGANAALLSAVPLLLAFPESR